MANLSFLKRFRWRRRASSPAAETQVSTERKSLAGPGAASSPIAAGQTPPAPLPEPTPPVFDVFVIDSGWNVPAHHVLKAERVLFSQFLKQHNLYVLDKEQSQAFLREHPNLIGKDPIVAIVDKESMEKGNSAGFGARLELGLVKDRDRVVWLLKMILRIVNNRRACLNLTRTIRAATHKEGFKGAVEIIMESIGQHGPGGGGGH
ncbi:MAG: hypothetical protein ACAI35_04175 [Candidatus Methylacidiphilales bacterium]|nr:hypothetical protein [Candidatus Methylacidiphilales bacterium]